MARLKSLTEEEVGLLLKKYVLGRIKLPDEEEKRVIRLFTKATTVQDLFNIMNSIVKPFERTIAGIMETIEIQDVLLDKLGATEKLRQEATEQHEKEKEDFSKKKQEEIKKLFERASVAKGDQSSSLKAEANKILDDVKKSKH